MPQWPAHSRGIRQRLYNLSVEGGWRARYGILLAGSEDVQGSYSQLLARSRYCLVAPGARWWLCLHVWPAATVCLAATASSWHARASDLRRQVQGLAVGSRSNIACFAIYLLLHHCVQSWQGTALSS